MVKQVQKLIVAALEYLDNGSNNIVAGDKGSEQYIDKTYDGYIASFGGSVVQAGILTTALVYSEPQSKREDIAKALYHLYKEHFDKDSKSGDLLALVKECVRKGDFWEEQKLTDRIVHIATALKLAMRSYEFRDEKYNS